MQSDKIMIDSAYIYNIKRIMYDSQPMNHQSNISVFRLSQEHLSCSASMLNEYLEHVGRQVVSYLGTTHHNCVIVIVLQNT